METNTQKTPSGAGKDSAFFLENFWDCEVYKHVPPDTLKVWVRDEGYNVMKICDRCFESGWHRYVPKCPNNEIC